MTKNVPSTSPRRLRTAPTISSSVARSARRPIRAPPPKASRRRSRPFLRPRQELRQEPLQVSVHGEEGAVKKHSVGARDADGGEILHLEVADFIRLVLDVDPAEVRVREFCREREETQPVLVAGVAPRGAKAAHLDHA